MSIAATFLGGAKSRLLPASIPFRFFAAAAVFHVLLWLVLLAAAGEAVSFRGGLGSTLASVHLLTLGVLTTTAIGASVQLLPVTTRRWLHADNLRRASGLAVVGAYGWAALAALVMAIALGLALAFNEEAGFLPDH